MKKKSTRKPSKRKVLPKGRTKGKTKPKAKPRKSKPRRKTKSTRRAAPPVPASAALDIALRRVFASRYRE